MTAIRPAEAADEPVVRRIVDAAYSPYIARMGQQPGPMRDDYTARIAASEVWILDHAGNPEGIIVLIETPDHFMLDNVAVSPESHGKGHGRALLIFAEQQAARRGHSEIHLYTHALMTANRALYARIGYSETGRRTENGFDRVYMVKRIAP